MENFKFKQFQVSQQHSAMKVGTDGILLGSWTPLSDDIANILDVGSGTGLVALMLAQRSLAPMIDAVEIDPEAYEECVTNFEQSPWNDRLFCYHASFREFAEEMDESYDLIVSNPPFFEQNIRSGDHRRDKARFRGHLPLEALLAGCDRLLSGNGILSVIYPFEMEEQVIEEAMAMGLHARRICRIKDRPGSAIRRSLMVFGRQPDPGQISNLTLKDADGDYSKEYRDLTADFYLKM